MCWIYVTTKPILWHDYSGMRSFTDISAALEVPHEYESPHMNPHRALGELYSGGSYGVDGADVGDRCGSV